MGLFLYCFLQLTQVSCGKLNHTVPIVDSGDYKLIWSDEFNKDGSPDSAKWRFESGFARNEEAQWYQSENAVCEGGYLVISARKERKPNPTYIPGSTGWKTKRDFIDYTSSSVVMKREHAFQYGKVEVRAKIDAQTGLWPAIWTLGTSGKWPANGEVDIMEYYNDGILANFAIEDDKQHQALWDGSFKTVESFGGQAWASQFHTWTLEWDEDSMTIKIDDSLLNTIDLNETFNKTDGKNPFRQPHYLLLNLAMGGTKGGSLANTVLPTRYMIDYVRIYQKK